jgi:hypothetical protein
MELFFSELKMDNEKASSVNVKILREQLNRLTHVKDIPIRNLSESYLDDFTSVSHHITTMYGTDGYNLLFDEVQSKFPMHAKVTPGTVGGYFLGCFTPSNFKYGDTCSLGCVTGAPIFHDSVDIIPCQRNVYIAPYDVGYKFTKLVSGTEEPSIAILFIQPPFQGFSPDEIYELRNQGIEKVVLSYYDDNKGEYFVSDPLSYSQIQSRSASVRTVRVSSTTSTGERVFQIVGIVLLLLVAGYALWTMRNN